MVYLPTFTINIWGPIQFNIIQYAHMSWSFQHQPTRTLRLEASLMWCSNSARCFWSWDSSSWRTRFFCWKGLKKTLKTAWNLLRSVGYWISGTCIYKTSIPKDQPFLIWFQIRYQNLLVAYKFIGFHLCSPNSVVTLGVLTVVVKSRGV